MCRPSLPIASALELLSCIEADERMMTFCSTLDKLLGGDGIPLSKITEVCGAPGTGKTQLCLQLAVNVQIPKSFGGLEGETVYVDSENSFLVERLTDIATAAVERLQRKASFVNDTACLADIATFSVDGILRGVHYVSCDGWQHLKEIVDHLEDFIEDHPKVKLVIVDSVTFHLQETSIHRMSYPHRTAFLLCLSQRLTRQAAKQSFAVILTNHMTTRFTAYGKGFMAPALGDAWSHACPTRLLLSEVDGVRTVQVFKSSSLPDATARFDISTAGICNAAPEATTETPAATLAPFTFHAAPARAPNRLSDYGPVCKRAKTEEPESETSTKRHSVSH